MVYHILLAVAAVAAAVIYRLLQVGKRGAGLPPGPPTIPVLGNLLSIPPRYAHLYFAALRASYGDIVSLKLFGTTMIVLNSCQAVIDLLEKRSASFNDRPPAYINDDLISKKHHILLANGRMSSMYRRLYNRALKESMLENHAKLQAAEGVAVLFNILQRPSEWYDELRRYSCSLTLSLTFGKRAPTFYGVDKSGFSVAKFYELEHRFNFFLEVGAAPPIDLLPVLKYLPGFLAPWKAKARQLYLDMKDFYQHVLYDDVKERLHAGQALNCWMQDIIENNVDNLREERLAWAGGVMMEGGSDTTSGALLTFVLAAATHPEAVRKAQSELDEVIGQDRLPTLEDAANLPYCLAFIKEVLRWRPVAPAGVPHLSTREEFYAGYRIPAGSIVILNTWGINRHPEHFDEPDKFEPERFVKRPLGLKEGLDSDGFKEYILLGFGAGRRVCLGQDVADQSLKLLLPALLQCFTFTPVGQVSVNNFEPGHLTAPVKFECDIKPRNEHLAQVIVHEYEGYGEHFEKLVP